MPKIEMLEAIIPLFGNILVITGIFFIITSMMGVVRVKDDLSKIHAMSVADSVGAPLCYLGYFFMSFNDNFSPKFLLAFLLCYITYPLASHSIGKMIYQSSYKQ